jgi:TRAF3-interacting protein 1
LIDKPKMQEKFLIKPPPRYIYDMLMSTFGKTGFPPGLFTDEEMDSKYFEAVSIKSHFRT